MKGARQPHLVVPAVPSLALLALSLASPAEPATPQTATREYCKACLQICTAWPGRNHNPCHPKLNTHPPALPIILLQRCGQRLPGQKHMLRDGKQSDVHSGPLPVSGTAACHMLNGRCFLGSGAYTTAMLAGIADSNSQPPARLVPPQLSEHCPHAVPPGLPAAWFRRSYRSSMRECCCCSLCSMHVERPPSEHVGDLCTEVLFCAHVCLQVLRGVRA